MNFFFVTLTSPPSQPTVQHSSLFHLNPAGSYDENIVEATSGFSCGLCGKMFAKRFVCRRHIKELHFSVGRNR